ncbi:MAG: hypothetical protein Q6M04_04340 [Thermostichus sp. BF3_bins_97]
MTIADPDKAGYRRDPCPGTALLAAANRGGEDRFCYRDAAGSLVTLELPC